MSKKLFNISSYFERIKYEGGRDVSYETLCNLHMAHMMNIPFENLNVYYKKPVLLDMESLYNKIVENKRGGYCFEMNGFFSFILKELGFKVTDLLARVAVDGKFYSAKTHQVLMVEIHDKRWLVDVGFGRDGIIIPLLLAEGIEQQQFGRTFRLLKDPKFGYVLQNKVEDEYNNIYAFTLEECYPLDYVMSSHFTSTFHDSWFTKMRFCTMPTKEGRITLTDECFKAVENGQVSERNISNEAEFNELLKKYFGIDLEVIKEDETIDDRK
ncbi:arylamine N-acetyltransferase [Clostridium carboxidivorans P7]|uniref:Arylamine N-acetyltransferase n=1 Tax=Clostridium carboxidivorans P7 TaxID=536227 RepID=C6Q102_9CLOT|nr:arylamine N-acetyltransferase [Clostridium carboxidivorans]AKN33767.1 arylamine N-acetyltransferase [Clostridium carboxidivorans P7]EET84821.1 Arylamine N-acetyltransferase [Clostridium carboxidivorans P7]EFG86627.1 N-acetyltransferase [Clostridium carboxidivorans P7]